LTVRDYANSYGKVTNWKGESRALHSAMQERCMIVMGSERDTSNHRPPFSRCAAV